MAMRIYGEIEKIYGRVRFDQPESKNVIGSVHLYKDMDFAVYQEGTVKTIRVYEP